LNRSKESLTLDLKDPRGLAVLHELLARADVFVENLAPGATKRLGLSKESLGIAYPSLVVCEITGYGDEGPWADRKAYDLLVQSETGLVSVTGDGEVVAKVGISVADIAAGMFAYSGVLAALIRRATTGVAAPVQVSLFDALSEWMTAPAYYTMYTGRQPSRRGVEHATVAPYGLYRTGEDALVLAVQNEREWQRMCDVVLGDASLADDPRFSTNTARVENREAVSALISGKLAALDTETAEALLDQAGVAHARVNSMQQAIDHPSRSGRDRWREVASPAGAVQALIPPVTLGGVEPRMDPVPAIGAHTASILTELGRSTHEIEALTRDGVVSL
jgi:formyl-CoA transferase